MTPLGHVAVIVLSCALVPWLVACRPAVAWYGHSPDRRQRVSVVEAYGQQRLVLGDEVQQPFRGIALEAIVFSRNGRHLAYAAQSDEGWHVVRDGSRGMAHDGVGAIVFSRDGRHLAYAARDANRWRVMRDGAAGPAVRGILQGTLQFSEDGTHLAYVAETADGVAAMLDHRAGRSYDGIAELSFLPGAAELAFVARRSSHSMLVRASREGPPCDGIGDLAITASRVAYAALQEPHWLAVVDGVRGPPYERVEALVFSPDGRHLAYVARRDGRAHVVRDGVESSAYRRVDPRTLGFSRRGQLLYAAEPLPLATTTGPGAGATDGHRRSPRGTASAWHLFVDGVPGKAYDRIEPPRLAVRGPHWGTIARRDDRFFVVIDGRESIPYRAASDLVLSADGRRYAYLARRGRHDVVAWGTERIAVPAAVRGTLVLDRSGQHWACLVALRSARKLYVTVDGRPRRPFDLEELTAELARRRRTGGNLDHHAASLLRRWVAAELELALSDR